MLLKKETVLFGGIVMKYELSKTEIDKLMKHIIILVDKAEKENGNEHIINFFDKKKIKYEKYKLKEADYSAKIECNEETKAILGITKDLYFTNDILIERKRNLEEVSGNLVSTKGNNERNRFKFEFTRMRLCGAACYLLIEDKDGEEKIRNFDYKTAFKPLSFYRSLKSFESNFRVALVFKSKEISPSWIKETIYAYVKVALNNNLLELLEE